MKKILFTGIRPTGDLHLGHYYSIIEPLMKHSNNDDIQIYIMIADLHSLTEMKHGSYEEVYNNIHTYSESIINTLARFIPFEKTVIFRQSDMRRYHYDLFYKLLMISKHQFTFGNPIFLDAIRNEYFNDIDLLKLDSDTRDTLKDYILNNPELCWGHIPQKHIIHMMLKTGKSERQVLKIVKQLNERTGVMGLASYPILMAADILLYFPEYVLVGKDQAPHLQITNDIAKLLNNSYNLDIRKIEPMIVSTETLKGNDGRKMSKSYNNHLQIEHIFSKQQPAHDWIMKAKTFPRYADQSGDPDQCVIGSYIELLIPKSEIISQCRLGCIGCVACKEYLFNVLIEYMQKAAQQYQTYNFRDVIYRGASTALDRLSDNNQLYRFISHM